MRDLSAWPYRRLATALAMLAVLLLGLRGSAAASPRDANIQDLLWRQDGAATYVTLRLSGPVRYRTAAAADVLRIDLWTIAGEADRIEVIPSGIASRVTVRRLTPDVARMGISLRRPARFRVYTTADRMTVAVFPEQMGVVPLPQSVAYRALHPRTGAGSARAHVVTLDSRVGGLAIQPALGGAAVAAVETTSATATRLAALAAINGTYYSRAGLPLGLLVIDERVLSTPLPRRPVFAVESTGRMWIGEVEFTGRLVTTDGRRVPISAVNRPPRVGGIALYTPEFGPLTFTQSHVALIRDDHVSELTQGRPVIPANGYALAATEAQRHLFSNLTPGDRVLLDLAVSPPGIRHAIQGGPLLVRDGKIDIPYEWEGFTHAFFRVRTARSAIGITRSGKILFVAVDGRGRQSTGMNLRELAGLMQSLGAETAMNLDGGGSSTLVVGGRVVSALPPGGERTVSSMLVAVRRPSPTIP